jgi:hypothetical protein
VNFKFGSVVQMAKPPVTEIWVFDNEIWVLIFRDNLAETIKIKKDLGNLFHRLGHGTRLGPVKLCKINGAEGSHDAGRFHAPIVAVRLLQGAIAHFQYIFSSMPSWCFPGGGSAHWPHMNCTCDQRKYHVLSE